MNRIKWIVLVLFTLPTVLFGEAKELRFHYLSTENGLPRNSTFSIVEDKFGFIWVATNDGLCRFDGYEVKHYVKDAANPKSIFSNRPKRLLKDKQGNVWIMFTPIDPVCRYNYETDDFSTFEKKFLPPLIQTLLANSVQYNNYAENVEFRWEMKNGMLYQTTKSTHELRIYRFNPKNETGLKDELVTGIRLDSRAILWVATESGGVCYADVNQPVFQSLFFTHPPTKSINDAAIRTICMDHEGHLWTGTRQSGVSCINRTTKIRTTFKHNESDPYSLSDDQVRRIFKDRFGQLWFGTKNGVDRFLPKAKHFKHYPPINSKHPNNWIYAMEEDGQGDLWIGTWQSGIARYDRAKDVFISYRSIDPDPLWNIRTLLREGSTDLWIGSESNGLTWMKRRIEGEKERCTFKNFTQKEHGLTDNRVFCLCKDRDGFLWIGTGRGLNRLNPRTEEFIHFPEKRYLSNGIILGILNDEAGHIWVSHSFGLTRIDTRTFKTNDYNTHTDLSDNAFTEDAYFRDPNSGECYFGGNFGITKFNPALIRENATPPQLAVTDFQISGKSVEYNQKLNGRIVLKRQVYLTKSIILKWSERSFELKFAALHFSNPANNTFAYRLKGFDNAWKYTDATSRIASYTNLSAGHYVFELKAASSNGIWTAAPLQLEIEVLPPWWRVWWAFIIYALLLASIVYLAFKRSMNRMKAEKARALEAMRSNFFTNISHELRTPLTLILDPINRLIAHPNGERSGFYREIIKRNSERLLTLVNELLDVRKAEEGRLTLNQQPVDLIALIHHVRNAFLFKSDQRQLNIDFSTDKDQLVVYLDPERMETILFNLLSNAVKHSEECSVVEIKLRIDASKPSDTLEIYIRNQGKTINPDDLEKLFDPFYQASQGQTTRNSGSGIGLTITKQLVELHGGTISVTSINGMTEFSLHLPCVYAENVLETTDENSLSAYIPTISSIDNPNVPNVDLPLILLIEDHADIREYIRSEFRDNFQILEAATGEAGLEMAQAQMPELIISDVMMPGISGFEVCARLKKDLRTSHIPVVLLTARHSEASHIEGYETGADAYVTKPFNSAVLRVQIQNLLDQRQRLRELFTKGNLDELKKMAVNVLDESFLTKVIKLVEENMSNNSFDIESLAEGLHMSRSQFYRKVKALTNKSLVDFVTTIRMNKALEYLLSGAHNVSEVSYMVGYSAPSNFSRAFIKQFGTAPTKFLQTLKKQSLKD